MPFVNCNKFNTSQATQDQAIADLAQDLLNKQNALNDCSGKPLAGTVPTCAQMNTAISSAISGGTSPTGAAGGDLEGTYPNPTVKDQAIADAVTGSAAVKTAVAGVFNRCDGTDMPAGASLIECSAKGTDIPYLVSGVIPATQLPAYVDDVLEFPALANFPATGEAGKIYIDASTGKTYRWNGTGYTEISASAGITVQDEGSVLTTAATSLNFVGAGVQATSSGGAVTVTVPSATTTYIFSGNGRPTGTPVNNGGSSYAQNAEGEMFLYNGTEWVLIGNGVFKEFVTNHNPAISVPNGGGPNVIPLPGAPNDVVIQQYTAPRDGVLVVTGFVDGTILIGDTTSPSRLAIDVVLTENGIDHSSSGQNISYFSAGDGLRGTHTAVIQVAAGDLLELRCVLNCVDISNQQFLISNSNLSVQYMR